MNGPNIVALIVYTLCAAVFIGLGVSNRKSKKPVGFYSGEKGPSKEELTDWQEWNRRHGNMWIIYGIIIIASFLVSWPLMDSPLVMIPMIGGFLIPIPVMIHLHKKYLTELRK